MWIVAPLKFLFIFNNSQLKKSQMNYLKFSAIILLFLVSSCCNKVGKKTIEPAGTEELQPANIMKKENQNKLSPGTAEVICTITELSDTVKYMRIKVNAVSGYGMATRPIPPGTEMELAVSDEIKNRLKDKKEGEELNLIISQQNSMQSENIRWNLESIINQ